ncbi:MAG: IS110 family transposase [Erysipelotrichaceae bacterium]|nr:IS110 family transposase [Erysipelotrichaceae bacterium]
MSFKIVRFNCCGMDVHKDIIVATVGITDHTSLITDYHQESFTSLNSDLYRLCDWLDSFECKEVCMESTGKYWIPIFNVLEDHGIKVCLAHPKYTKAIKGKKTDKKDSKWICDLYKHDMVKGSFIPPKAIRALREIARYYRKLVGMDSSESNRYQNCMSVSNLGIGSVFKDVNGKSASRIMDAIMEAEDESCLSDEDILKLVHSNCKKKDKVLDAIRGAHIESDTKFKIKVISMHKKELANHIEACLTEMFKRAQPYFDQFIHITEITGISLISAILIISEIGVDMSVWENARQLCCWAGLTPANNESAGKKKSVRISKAGQYLKPLLVQCALAAIKNPKGYFGIKYRRIKKRRGHKKAIIAVARMMLICIYHMILTGESFKPSDYDELMNPNPKHFKELSVSDAIDFLKEKGVDIETIKAAYSNTDPPPKQTISVQTA